MHLKKLICSVKPKKIIGETEGVAIANLTLDSRKCTRGSLYFAIAGTQVDGHQFIPAAIEAGAAAIVVEREVDCAVPQIIVGDCRAAMSYIAAEFYGLPSQRLMLVGVTGTNGKTTTTHMLRAIAMAKGISTGMIGTSGIYLNEEKLDIKIATSTTPDPIELQYILRKLADGGAEWVVMEVTAHALDLRKTEGVLFASAVFINLTQDHLDYFGDMEHYYNAKASFFKASRARNAVVNIDDSYGQRLKNEISDIPVITCGINENCNLKAENIEMAANGSTYSLHFNGIIKKVQLHCAGAFNIYNSLCAIGSAMQCGLSLEDCIAGIQSFKFVAGRFETPDMAGRDFSVVIDYAHTPDGLENILKAINEYKRGRLICVFGCGGNRDPLKRPIMGYIASKNSDFCIITSDNPRYEDPEAIIEQIVAGMEEGQTGYVKETNRYKAIQLAFSMAQKDDVIVLAGKGDEDYQEINGEKLHFSDREAVQEILTLRSK